MSVLASRWLAVVSVATAAAVWLAPTLQRIADAQPAPTSGSRNAIGVEPDAERIRRLEQQFDKQFDQQDWPGAESTLRQLCAADPDNFVPVYNLACVLAMQGKSDEAVAHLRRSIDMGFADLRHMQADPNLESIRDTKEFREIVASWTTAMERRAAKSVEEARAKFGPGYTFEKDESLRLIYASAFPAKTFEQAKTEIKQLAGWWQTEVLGEDPPKPQATEPSKNEKPSAGKGSAAEPAGKPAPAPWVMVVLPSREDYAIWGQRKFGDNWIRIGGSYSDDDKTLVAQDLGPTLRHEYWHSLHWRDMRRRGQMHPIWIMEGLCSLVEDVEAGPGGRMVVLPSWRTNMAKRRERGGALAPWSLLFEMPQKKFVGGVPLARYAESRTIFVFLAQQGKLKAWYKAYVDGYAEDPTGKSAMEAVFGKPVAQVEKDYRTWLRTLAEVPEEVPRGSATLPFNFEMGDGDGIVVTGPLSALGQPGRRTTDRDREAANRESGLKLKDVITSIDGKPVRDMSEVVRVLGQYQPGQTVEVEYRRGSKAGGKASVRLVAAKGS